jgi:hypothetical protein
MAQTVSRECVLKIARKIAETKASKVHNRHIYLELTEGRDDWVQDGVHRSYGYCGDFVTYCLMHAGVRDGRILNRAALNDGKWAPGDNIARLVRWARATDSLITPQTFKEQIKPADPVILHRKEGGSHPPGDHICLMVGWLDRNLASFQTVDGNRPMGRCDYNANVMKVPGSWEVYGAVSLDKMPISNMGETDDEGDVLDTLSKLVISMGGDGPPPTNYFS